jgi:nucleotide-binding universal stress UspA family protein
MKRFKNILVVHDEGKNGQATLARAVELAGTNQARLTLMHVIDQLPDEYRMLITSLLPDEIMEMAIQEQIARLKAYAGSFSVPITVRVVAGREFLEIIRQVLRESHDLVIKTARGMSGVMGMLFGSTAMHLLRKCPCPVWLIKPGSRGRFARIMAAVDVVPAEVGEDELNIKILELASSLARQGQSELHIVHAWQQPDGILASGRLDYFAGDAEKLLNESENMHVRWLDDLLASFDLKDIRHHDQVVRGWPDEAIPAYAREKDIDLIVMGTVCRTGIPGFFIGNTAEKILHRVDCSVLAVKPDGFQTPVTLEEPAAPQVQG